MGINLTGIGLSGINAAEAEIQTVEANITNANNPNYSAESVQLSTRAGPDGASIGVDLTRIERAEAPFLTDAMNQAQSTDSFNSSFARITQLGQTYLAPASGNDLLKSLQDLFNSFTNLSASPADPNLRSAVLNAAGGFATLSQGLSLQLNRTAMNELSGLSALVQQVNDDSRQVASINGQIQRVRAGGGSAAALLDQRDALASDLANLIGARMDAKGNVAIAGVPLVSGNLALPLSVTGSGSNVSLQVALLNGNLQMPAGQLGGSIGGILAAATRVGQLNTALNDFVVSVATAINTQHQSGFGLDGSTGNQLFLIGGGGIGISLNPAVTVQNLAASQTLAGVPGDGSNAAAMAALAKATGLDTSFPTSTLGQAYGQIVSDFGSSVQGAMNAQLYAAASFQSLNQLKGSITGVSLNEELTHLVQFKNALEAAGRAVQIANDITTFLITEIS
jgi:flagellar hook-associated protein 1 FlgK